MPRLFIGIPVPDSYQSKMTTLTRELASDLNSTVKWTNPGNAHITLRFLGEVDSAGVKPIREVLATIDYPAFHIRAGGITCIPNKENPRSLWANIMKGLRPCSDLAKTVETSLLPLEFPAAKKPFKCHMTLGRIKKSAPDDWKACLRKASGMWPGFLVDRFILWESTLTPDGPIYSIVDEFVLTQTA